ncbi:MAG: hypothetical protein OEV42_17925 [Deltaproteobacteria bacterium]|nr:hypothetical protein [Deltaproteobacteria bacterium]
MNFRIFILLLLVIAGFLRPSFGHAAKSLPESALAKVNAALKKGELSRDEAALYKTFSIFDQGRLPERFKRTGPVVPVKNGTIIIRQLKKDFETLSPQTQETLRPYLFKKKGRLSGKTLYKTNAISSNVSQKTVLETHLLDNWTTTANFNIEWGNAVPVDAADVARWAEYFEKSWFEIISSQGYAIPKGADTKLVDVYIANTGSNSNILYNNTLASGWYGFTHVWDDYPGVPYIVVNNNYTWAPLNDDLDGKVPGAMKVTAAHEFFHTIHLTIDYWEDGWWMETSSTWMEDHVYDGVNDYHNYIGPGSEWTLNPNVSLLFVNGSHEYENVIWGKYLSEKWGGAQAIKSIWDNSVAVQGSSSVVATNSFFISHSSTLSDAFKDFAAKNLFMNYSEGSNYGSMEIRRTYSSYTSGVQSSLSLTGKSPDYLGTNYIRFVPASGPNLTITFDGDEYYRGRNIVWGATIVIPTLAGYSSIEIPLDSGAQNGFAMISGYHNYSALYLVANVLSETGLTPAEYAITFYADYPDGIPYAFHACENCSAQALPLMEFLDNDEVVTIANIGWGGGGGSGGGCFIATAAYGYYDEPHVMVLRDFRDKYLMTNGPGRSFVDFYYRMSPGMADFISEREWSKSLVRILLMPLIGLAWLLLNMPAIPFFFTFILLSAVILRLYSHKNRSKKLIS